MNVFLVDSRTYPRESWRLYFLSVPQAQTIPSSLLVIYCEYDPPRATSRLFLLNDAANCNSWGAKKKPGTLELYNKFRSTMPDAASRATMMG